MASPIRALPYYLHTLASMWQTDWLTDDDDDDEDKDVDIPTLAWDDKRRRIIIIKTAKTNENKIKLHATLNISPRCRRNPNRTHTHTQHFLSALFLPCSFSSFSLALSAISIVSRTHQIIFFFISNGSSSSTRADICSWSVYDFRVSTSSIALFAIVQHSTCQRKREEKNGKFFSWVDRRFLSITQCVCGNLMPRSNFQRKIEQLNGWPHMHRHALINAVSA